MSPTTAYLDKKSKLRVYARTALKELWIVDPEIRLVHVYRLQENADQPAQTCGENDTFNSPHFPGLEFHVSEFFKRVV